MFTRFARSPALWIASPGGHLTEALQLEQTIGASEESVWITARTPQTLSALSGRRVLFVPYVSPRDWRGSLRVLATARKALQTQKFAACFSTGAALAAASLLYVAFQGVPTYYVESLARRSGSSLTGKLLGLQPGIRRYTQYRDQARPGWQYTGSLLDGWLREESLYTNNDGLKVFVALGTIKPYRFDRAVRSVLSCLSTSDSVQWQLGSTFTMGLPGTVDESLTHEAMLLAMSRADVVVCQAGVGSILDALGAGKVPVVLVRSSSFGEHVDDHQAQIADALAERGLGYRLDLNAPDRELLQSAARSRVRPIFDKPGTDSM